ncbi:sigma-54 interaction domain-containing protein [Pseudoprimorskyibacter insulae]|uniref:Nif-specific regulatory protein n=1 Tax=Pseudoprimorskyibacter insulae TaxID=1695997 RepID=A0A2R8AVQ7_9RHOB|nr:sigma-54 dependent transcriptional regulator [Pseudoprimorskyibacter insulae]SPF80103.1 Transcriptional regulatory protein ZraR [Pseudoprimorskyibacter insulae]
MTKHYSLNMADETKATDCRLDCLLVGESPVMQGLKRLIATVAPGHAPVMVQGATGVGKELVAQGIHMMSGRDGQMVAVNCAAIPADLLESELFGHEKGAFTGATERRIGRIEQANGGTLFLDEIGDMPADLQAKLLRALESRRVQRVGGRDEVEVNFRLVTATHRNLADHVKAGLFREDLFFRINVFPMMVPDLNMRTEDIPMILRTMMLQHRDRTDLGLPEFTQAALKALAAHSWPGNVRELRNVVDRAMVLFAGRDVTAEDVRGVLLSADMAAMNAPAPACPERLSQGPEGLRRVLESEGSINMRGYLQDIEIRLIEAALSVNEGCVSHAARSLKLQRTTLIEKMKKLSIDRTAAAAA